MMNCPDCGSAAHTRSSFQASKTTKERYNQCQNINCECTFITHETFVRYIVKTESVAKVPPHPSAGGQSHMIF
ncbi:MULTISPECIES: ogr/Delta-like zinc finger family protein [Pseudescherichia]|uniref:ogr/Delta-like zinc finger family protein n=1 Tax=Pseudescherichia TaxID=2055880 RepID=UPI0021500D8A|nr:ogr/Delta-like zinc finger family protein [Pseudescherichia sp. L3]MCR4458434.1 ogr/Delta-like zinc finger family protein [Pseudescherichia sp. L3]